MKKIISLALAAGMLVGATAQAQAADISAYGLFRVQGEWEGNTDAIDATTFTVRERVELGMKVAVSDEVLGNFRVRVPAKETWAGQTNVDVALREAFIQFPVAGLTARVGYQLPSLPTIASGANPYSRGWVSTPGVALVGNFGSVMPSLSWWVQGASSTTYNSVVTYEDDENISAGVTDVTTTASSSTAIVADTIVLQIPVALADGMKLTPWAAANMYKNLGGSFNGQTETAFGASFDANVDAISAGAGVIGAMTSEDNKDMSFVVAANAAMDLGALTPGLAVWYGLGGDCNDFTFWGGFNNANDTIYGNGSWMQSGVSGFGLNPFDTLGVQVNVADIALGETAKLGAHVMYVMENDGDDSVLEIGGVFSTQVAKGLTGVIDANYAMDMGESLEDKDGFSVAFGVNMAF